MSIQSFGDKKTEDIWNGQASSRTVDFTPEDITAAQRKLDMLNAAHDLGDLRAGSNKLEALKGTLAGSHSIKVNKQWEIIFRWTPDGPEEVRIVERQ